LKLFGSVLLAIDAPTKQESRRNGSDTVQATRFLYQAKASKKDRNEGLEDFDEKRESDRIKEDGVGGNNPRNRTNELKKNHHPTVKPTELMRYLIKLVTPPGGTVLDPFAGSGSTGKACKIEGFNFIGIEKELEYVTIAKARIEATKPKQLTLV
jgi:site-specific DNA-methyltransferase (adenine-specific)